MPLVEGEPTEEEDAGGEDEAEHAGDGGGGEEGGVFGLAGEDDRLETEAPAVTGGAAGGVIADERADGREGGGDAEAGEKIRERGGDAEAESSTSVESAACRVEAVRVETVTRPLSCS